MTVPCIFGVASLRWWCFGSDGLVREEVNLADHDEVLFHDGTIARRGVSGKWQGFRALTLQSMGFLTAGRLAIVVTSSTRWLPSLSRLGPASFGTSIGNDEHDSQKIT
jgi:hypothetical protein